GSAPGGGGGGTEPAGGGGGVVGGSMNGMPIVRMPDGSIKIGNGIIIKGDPAFQQKVIDDLGKISQTPTGAKLLKSIDDSGKTVTIVKTGGGNGEDGDSFNT